MPRRPRRVVGRTARETAAAYMLPMVMVDSNVLIDVLEDDPAWHSWSSEQLEPLIASRRAVINPLIYAEIAASYASIEALEHAIADLALVREPLPWEAAFMASQAYKLYRGRGGGKRSPLPDFYIGAHATLAGYPLLTRDPDRYRGYFARLKLIAPG